MKKIKQMKYSINYAIALGSAINLNFKIILFDVEKKTRRHGLKNTSTYCY